jgi:hypothetical protein
MPRWNVSLNDLQRLGAVALAEQLGLAEIAFREKDELVLLEA